MFPLVTGQPVALLHCLCYTVGHLKSSGPPAVTANRKRALPSDALLATDSALPAGSARPTTTCAGARYALKNRLYCPVKRTGSQAKVAVFNMQSIVPKNGE